MRREIVLIKLLRRVDAARLEVMLEPEVLLRLMIEHGYAEAELRARLAGGAAPGELLLELLEARDADAVWASLSPRVRARAREKESWFTTPRLLSLMLGTVGPTFGALSILDPNNPHEAIVVPIGWVVTGAAGAWLFGRVEATRGAVAGVVVGVGVAASAWLATGWIDSFPSRWELLAVELAGALPGVGLGLWFARRARERAGPREF